MFLASSPERTSRLLSRPTTKKKMTISIPGTVVALAVHEKGRGAVGPAAEILLHFIGVEALIQLVTKALHVQTEVLGKVADALFTQTFAGILRQWAAAGYDPGADQGAHLALLTHENELLFLRKALELPEVLARVVSDYEAHHLAFYAHDLAGIFHRTYETCRVLHSEVPEPLRLARLRFYRAAKQLLARTLDLMGMTAPEVM